jgi:magnesium transporter
MVMTQTLTRAYRRGALEAESFPVADVSDYLEDPDTIVWVDVAGPSPTALHELAEELGLHELAVEDAIGPEQRPKVDRYPTHLFLTSYYVRVDPEKGEMEAIEVDAFFNKRWLITVRRGEGFPIEEVMARWDRSPDLVGHGVGFLLYGLLDVVVDGYFRALSDFDDYYETVSDGIFAEQPLEPSQQRHWFDMRRETVRFHRLVVPTREVVNALMRHEGQLIPTELYVYYQDVYDHILRITESSDSLRELVAAIVETNLSLRDYRQNLIVKKVSSWAAIVAVPALITGYYGMNVPFPGFAQVSGVVASSLLMVAVSASLYLIFRRNDWL